MTELFRTLVKEKPLSIIAGVVILLLILVAIFADVLAPYPHDEVGVIISEAALSFLGFGLPISWQSWAGC